MISRTPAKAILFGEHAVVYGEPAIAMAIDLYSHVEVSKSEEFLVDGSPPEPRYHSYIIKAYEMSGLKEKVNIKIRSHLSASSGLGSSASVTVGTISTLFALKGEWSKTEIAKTSFDVEYAVQGRASPVDTSTVTAGGFVIVSRESYGKPIWEIEKNGIKWYVSSLKNLNQEFIIANSGVRGSTGNLVQKVYNFVSKNSFGMDIIREIGKISMESIKYLEERNLEKIGELMNRNNKLLTILGVGHEKTSKIIDSVKDFSYGAKITGAGGGGSVIILPKNEEKVKEILERSKIKYYLVRPDLNGVVLIN
ncbi:MAG: mevalonate kinase [Thermoplasmata archaeon]|nr:mevalonate kinase [Thermoplasmata archaeon]